VLTDIAGEVLSQGGPGKDRDLEKRIVANSRSCKKKKRRGEIGQGGGFYKK